MQDTDVNLQDMLRGAGEGRGRPVHDLMEALSYVRDELIQAIGVRGFHDLLALFAERRAERLLGQEAKELGDEASVSLLPRLLARMEASGCGRANIVEHDWQDGWLLLESPDAAKTEYCSEQQWHSKQACCDILRGQLTGIYRYLRRREGESHEVVGIETSCASQGAPSCRFAIGTVKALETRGLRSEEPGYQAIMQVQKTLAASIERETKLREFVDTMPYAVLTLDHEGRITFSNNTAGALVGVGPMMLLGKHVWDFIHAEDREFVLEAFGRVMSGTGDPYPIEARVKGPLTSARMCSIDAKPIFDASGAVTAYQVIAVDTSAADGIWNPEQLLHQAIMEGTWPAIELEMDGCIARVNHAALRVFDRSETELLRLPVSSFLAEGSMLPIKGLSTGLESSAVGVWKLALPGGRTREFAVRLLPDGRIRGRVRRLFALLDPAGEEDELKRSLQRMTSRQEALAQSGSSVHFETDSRGIVTDLRGPVADIFGLDKEDLLTLPFPPFVHADDAASASAAVKAASGTAGRAGFLCRIRHRDGGWRRVECAVGAVKDFAGAVEAFVGTMEDVTERAVHESNILRQTAVMAGILKSSAVWTVVCDPQMRVTELAEAYQKATGFGAAERQGRPLIAMLAPGGVNALDRLMAGESPVRLPFARRGSVETCLVEFESIKLGEQESGLALIGVDVTEEVRREDAASERQELAMQLAELRSELRGRYGLDRIVGKDPKMRSIYETILAVSRTQATVLISGETGTGKELVAKAVHYNSPRREGPFVKVDCGALAETLLESEFFGHVKGAFTGAVADRPGRFEIANGGSIFLDEVQNLSMHLQSKLLRVVQDGAFEKVGAARTVSVDVRIIAATNEELEAMVARNRFRKDLYYRLNVIPIKLPPLRERRGDIPLLVSAFIERLSEYHGRDVRGISREALDRLIEYDWPGNVRELENIVEQAVVFCQGRTLQAGNIRLPESTGFSFAGPRSAMPLREALEDPEKRILLEALARTGGNKKRAAESLGISRSALYEKLKRFRLIPRNFELT